MHRESFITARDVYWLNFMGRLKPGVSIASAQADMNFRLRQFYLEQAGPNASTEIRHTIEGVRVHLKPGGGGISGLRYRYSQPLHVLMAVVAVVLLIACANIATLLLARASARRPEFLARLALGASRARLLRQVLTESVLLSFLGGAVGVGFAWWSIKLLVLLLHVDPVVKVRPDAIVLAFTFALSIATGILFGISLPLVQPDRSAARQCLPSDGFREVALSWSASADCFADRALIGSYPWAGLLAHSLFVLERQNIGFERNNILILRTDASLAGYQKTQLFSLYRDLGDRLVHLPGVLSASVARFTPVSGYSSSGNFSIEGYRELPGLPLNVWNVEVAPGFFETLQIPLLLGRTISPRDTPAAPAVAIVNQSFVNRYFPNQNPIGRHMSHGSPFKAPGAEIVGVVADSKFYDLREKAQPMVFYSLWQSPTVEFAAVLRTLAAPPPVSLLMYGSCSNKLTAGCPFSKRRR